MANKKRLPDALAVVVRETVPDARPVVSADAGEARIRRGMKAGGMFNYYETADGRLLQKMPVYLETALVVRLKTLAAQERRTVSALVREALADYLKKRG